MKGFGWAVLALGVLWILVAINMDVSVATGYGGRVNNLGLMASKQNHIILGAFITLCGLLTVLLTKRSSISSGRDVKCPFCAESIKPEAIRCKHCGADIAPQKSNNDDENFSPLSMSPDDFYVEVDHGYKFIDAAVDVLFLKLKKSNPLLQNMDLKEKYKIQIEDLTGRMPASIREEFAIEYEKKFRG